MRGLPSTATVWLRLSLVLVASPLVASCHPARPAAEQREIDSDPMALLPSDPTLVASVDVRAVFRDPALADSAVAVAHALLPLDAETGFEASRDVDRLVVAEYGGMPDESGSKAPETLVAASGQFDPEKLSAVSKTRDGAPIVSERYAGFSIQSTGAVSYSALSRRLLLVGTIGSVRRALERAKAGAVNRAVKPWISETLQASGSPIAAAADFEARPINAGAVGPLDFSWIGGLRIVRATGNFQPPGMSIAATLSYADPVEAERGAEGLHAVARWVKAVGPLMGGVSVQDLQIASQERDLRCTFAVDDATLRTLGAIVPRFLPSSGH